MVLLLKLAPKLSSTFYSLSNQYRNEIIEYDIYFNYRQDRQTKQKYFTIKASNDLEIKFFI